MAKPAPAVNKQSTALGVTVRKVIVEQVVPERGVAIVRDAMQYLTEIPYKVQQGRARIPRVGDMWYVDRSMGPWVFSAYIAKDDSDMATFTEKQTFSDGVAIPTNKQVNVGESTSDASFASVRANDTQAAVSIRKAGDTVDRVYWRTDGMLWLGPGGSTAPDVNLYRSAVNTLKTDDSLVVGMDFTPSARILKPIARGSGSSSVGSLARNTTHKVAIDTADFDTSSAFNLGSNRYVFPRLGYYRVSYVVTLNSFTTPTGTPSGEAWIDLNGAGGNKYAREVTPVSAAADTVSMSGTDIIEATALTDYIELYTRYNNGTAGTTYQQLAGALFPTMNIEFLG